MARAKLINSVATSQKKLTDLQSEIIQLQLQEKALQEKIILNLSTLLVEIGALSIPQETLIGGIIHLINSHKNNSPEIGEWQQSGRQFLGNKKSLKAKNSSTSSITQRVA